MMSRRSIIMLLVAIVTMLVASGQRAVAQTDVRVEAPPRAYRNIPFQVQLVISNGPGSVTPPELPWPDGIELIGTPSTSFFQSSINGRRRVDLTVAYPVVAREVGTLVMPSFSLDIDGRTFEIREVAITVESADAGDLMFVEIETTDAAPYLGETIELRLRLYVREFTDPSFERRLSGGEMWSMVALRSSQWSVFGDELKRALPRTFRGSSALPSRPVARTNEAGQRLRYHLYELRTEMIANKPGAARFDPVTVVMEYPERIGRDRRGNWGVAQDRLVMASTDLPEISVRLAPKEGRPDDYTGAIGRFGLEVTAEPTDVAVGDPITLTIDVLDESEFGIPSETIPGPSFSTLEDDFSVPETPLAGTASDRTKRFTQTIRARHDALDAIPPIEYVYFNPETESFEVATSDPIPIRVQPVTMISVEDVVGRDGERGTTEVNAVTRGLRANDTGMDILRTTAVSTPVSVRTMAAIGLAAPALSLIARFGIPLLRRRTLDSAGRRRRSARRRALTALSNATSAADGARIVTTYIEDRLDAAASTLTPTEIDAHLRDAGVEDRVRQDVRDVLQSGQAARYAGGVDGDGQPAATRMRTIIDDLESHL